MTATQLAEKFNYLTDRVHVIMLMRRKKEGGDTRTDRNARKYISRNTEEWIKIVEKLLLDKQDGERIYCTVNSRDMDLAIRKFKQDQLDNDYQSIENKHNFYIDIWNRLISCMNTPSSRESRYFLLDIDNDDRHGVKINFVMKRLNEENVLIIDKYKTKNGWHVITEPFQYPKLIPELHKWDHVKVDGMALIAY